MKDSFLYSKFVKVTVFLIGFLLLVGLVCAVLSAYGRYHFFGNDVENRKVFNETEYVQNIVSEQGTVLIDYINNFGRLRNRDYSTLHINLYDYHDFTNKTVYYTADLERDEKRKFFDIAQSMLYNSTYVDSDGHFHDVYTEFPYSFYDFLGQNKNYIRITSSEYINLIKMYADKVDSVETYADGIVPGIDTLQYTYYSLDDNSVVPIEGEISGSSTVVGATSTTDLTDDAQVIGSVLTIGNTRSTIPDLAWYSESEKQFFNAAVGYVDLEELATYKYLYIPIKYINNSNLERSIITAPYFNYAVAPFLAAMTDDDISYFESYVYGNVNLTGVSYCFKSNDSSLKLTGDQMYSSFDDARKSIDKRNNIIFEYDSQRNAIESYYYDSNGKKINFNYCNDIMKKNIDMMPSKTDFIFGIDLFNEGQAYDCTVPSSVYRFCRMIPQPIPTFIILLFFFILTAIFLSSTTGIVFDKEGNKTVKLGLIDKVPAEIFLVIFVCTLYSLFIMFRAGFMSYGYLVPPSGTLDYDKVSTVVAFSLVIFVVYFFMAFIFLSFVRRIRAGKFIKSLLVVKLYGIMYKSYSRITDGFSARLMMFIKLFIFLSVNVALMAFLVFNSQESIFTRYITIDALIIMVAVIFVILLDIIGIYKLIKYTNQIEVLIDVCKDIEKGDFEAQVNTEDLTGSCRKLGESLNNLGAGLNRAVAASTKDERLKAELITNVSHDIKTPLTSIINYVDLMKREDVTDPKLKEYISILDVKSQRLKQLTLDLIEASKVSTGNIELECVNLNFTELLQQAVAEFDDKFSENNLEVVLSCEEETPLIIYADGRRLYRIIENLFQNACKYTIQGSRVYMKLDGDMDKVNFSIKNVSREMLNISADELTERFVRGDKSRFTEGSGLGLSIARNLTELQNGTFEITIDGDLFKVDISFPRVFDYETPDEEEEYEEEPEEVQEEVLIGKSEETDSANVNA